jgi:hypothetical protein
MGIKERSAARAKRMVTHRAGNFREAYLWDLDYWQSKTPEERLSALVAIRRDVEKVRRARKRRKS